MSLFLRRTLARVPAVGLVNSLVPQLDLHWTEFNCVLVSTFRQLLDYGPAGITQSQQLCDFIEGLTGCIIERVTSRRVTPSRRTVRCSHEVQMCMST